MKKRRKPAPPQKDGSVTAKPADSPQTLETSFAEIVDLIQQARQRALQAVDTELVDLYWCIGEFIRQRIASDGWGKITVSHGVIACHIGARQPCCGISKLCEGTGNGLRFAGIMGTQREG